MSQQVCKTIGICLHFFLLATFFWMLVEGIYLISKTTSTRNRFLAMPTYIAIGWGMLKFLAFYEILSKCFYVQHAQRNVALFLFLLFKYKRPCKFLQECLGLMSFYGFLLVGWSTFFFWMWFSVILRVWTAFIFLIFYLILFIFFFFISEVLVHQVLAHYKRDFHVGIWTTY